MCVSERCGVSNKHPPDWTVRLSAFNRSSSQNVVLYATYFDVPVGTSPRIDAAAMPAGC